MGSPPVCTSSTSAVTSSSTSRRGAPCAPRPPSTTPAIAQGAPGVKKGLSNFAYLRTIGQRINTRLLQLEQVAHDCGLAAARLSDVTQPSHTAEGQPAPGLKFGDPRVTAVLAAQ